MEQAVLFADVSGSTRLYETIGDIEAKRLVDGCLDVLRAVTAEFHGRVIKTIGDELMCAFPSADAAAQAACEMQGRQSEHESATRHGLTIRIGFNSGPLIEENGDVFGDTVNTAARVTGLAKGGQIITTMASAHTLSPMLRAATRSMDSFNVRGKADSIEICEVIWQVENLTMMTGRLPPPQTAQTMSVQLVYSGGKLTLTQHDEAALIGRDASCRIAIAAPFASRIHAKIEFRRDKFVLTDTSTNGTYVQAGSDGEVVLKREEFILRGAGRISLGHSCTEGGADLSWNLCM